MPLIAQERAVSYTGAVYPEHDICSGFFYKIAETKKRRRKNGRGNRNGKMVMSKKKTVKMVKMGVMVAISVAMVYLVHFRFFRQCRF
mgnify:CR=1 FL=1